MHEREREREEKERISWCFDSKKSIVQELKLVHATRATRGYQNQSFSSNSKR